VVDRRKDMATKIRLKRVESTLVSQTLDAGELAIAATRLYYGRADSGVGATGLTPYTVVAQETANTLSGSNIFTGGLTIKNVNDANAGILFQNVAGTTYYQSLAGRLQTVGTFTFNDSDLVNKSYVDGIAQGLNVKASVRVATTGSITLSGTQTIDGIAVIADQRVLVKNQSTASQNGIYLVKSGAWVRSLDANAWSELTSAFVFVEEGTLNADTGWVCTVNSGGTLETTAVTWTQFSRAGVLTDGTGLSITGTVINHSNAVSAQTISKFYPIK